MITGVSPVSRFTAHAYIAPQIRTIRDRKARACRRIERNVAQASEVPKTMKGISPSRVFVIYHLISSDFAPPTIASLSVLYRSDFVTYPRPALITNPTVVLLVYKKTKQVSDIGLFYFYYPYIRS
jgi:hypothetical protein